MNSVRKNASRFSSERGGSRLKLLIVGLVAAVVIYSGAQFLPVYYNATSLKELMQRKVNEAVLSNRTTATPSEWVEAQIRAVAPDYGIPPDALIDGEPRERRVTLRVRYVKSIPLPFYVYDYHFDHTVTSSNFFTP